MEFLDYVDLSQNELRNARVQNLSSAPTSPVEGQLYYDTTLHLFFFYNGTTWVETDGRTAIPEGPAAGDLAGTYPNPSLGTGVVSTPKLADSAVTGPKVDASIKDAIAATPSLRTLGTGAQQATSGTDPRLSDKRISPDGSINDAQVANDAAIKLSKLAVDPLARANHTGTQLAQTISDFDQQVRTSRLDQLAKPTTTLDVNGQRIANVVDPVNPQDAATKAYVDAAAQGLIIKDPVAVATTGNITLSGLPTIDGITVTAGMRVLVKNQTTASQNGIYIAAAGTWTRALDLDSSAEAKAGVYTFVQWGTNAMNSGWVITASGPIALGSDPIVWAQFSGAGQIIAGDGLTKTGNQIDLVGTPNRITANADSVDISATYAGQASITTVGTVATGTWQGTPVGVAYGGTGAATPAAARANLAVAGKYTQTLNGGGLSEVITHNLNSQDVVVQVRRVASPYAQVTFTVEMTSVNTITLRSSTLIGANTFRVTVLG